MRLLQELRYHGVSQVEFKRDPRDGRFCLMEVNARHWMWHSLAAASGVNLSLAAYRDVTGHPYMATRQVDGRKWVVAITDVRDAQAEFRRHERDAAALAEELRRRGAGRGAVAARPRARPAGRRPHRQEHRSAHRGDGGEEL